MIFFSMYAHARLKKVKELARNRQNSFKWRSVVFKNMGANRLSIYCPFSQISQHRFHAVKAGAKRICRFFVVRFLSGWGRVLHLLELSCFVFAKSLLFSLD